MTKIYFLHIPKTGGQSFFKSLCAVFPEEQVSPCKLLPDVRRLGQEELQRFELYGGHLSYNFGGLLEGEVQYMTLLREPVSRTLSHIGHIRRDQENALHREAQLPIEEFLALDDAREMLSDVQTYLIAADIGFAEKRLKPGFVDGRPRAPVPGARPSRAPVMRSMRRSVEHMSKDEVVAQACRRLAGMCVVGLTDRFAESLERAARMIGRGPLAVSRVNVGGDSKPRPEEITPAALEMIKSINQMDLAVYDFARQTFEQALLEV